MKNTKAYKWSQAKADKLLKIDFFRFCVVGSVGFVVTAVFKTISQKLFHLDTVPAIFIGSEAGVVSNFLFHQNWTYNQHDHSHKSVGKKFFHFQLSSLSGVIIFTAIGGVMAKVFDQDNLIGLAVAAGLTMFWNFFWTKYFIFKGKTPAVLLDPEDTVIDRD